MIAITSDLARFSFSRSNVSAASHRMARPRLKQTRFDKSDPVGSTAPMSAAGSDPAAGLNGLNVSWASGCRTNRPSPRSGRR